MSGKVRRRAERRCSNSGEGGVLSLRDNIASRASMNVTGAAAGGAGRRLLPARPPPLRFIMSTAPPPLLLLLLVSLTRRPRSVTRVT